MKRTKMPWLFVVDHNGGRLLNISLTDHNRPHIDEADTIRNEWKPGHPQRLSDPNGGDSHPTTTHPASDDDRRHHFAKDVTAWLQNQTARRNIDELHLHAAPRFLGELRKVMPKQLREMIIEHEGDLTPLPDSELRTHPAVTALVHNGI